MQNTKDGYVPALGFHSLTRLYDPIVALTTRERTFKELLLRQADVGCGDRVLDLGCGTGTLAVALQRKVQGAQVVGLDGDERMLATARAKAARAAIEIEFDIGLSSRLPYPDATFDCVLSTLFFHHLDSTEKDTTAAQVLRVLKPGGEFHVADWGKPVNSFMRLLFFAVQVLDGFESTRDNVAGLLPQVFEESGFEKVSVRKELATMFGTLTLYSASKPMEGGSIVERPIPATDGSRTQEHS